MSVTGEPVIIARDLTRRFGEIVAVDHLEPIADPVRRADDASARKIHRTVDNHLEDAVEITLLERCVHALPRKEREFVGGRPADLALRDCLRVGKSFAVSS